MRPVPMTPTRVGRGVVMAADASRSRAISRSASTVAGPARQDAADRPPRGGRPMDVATIPDRRPVIDLPGEAALVVIGAGIVGASVAYHLAQRGWKDVVVVDQGSIPDTGGSTTHAP